MDIKEKLEGFRSGHVSRRDFVKGLSAVGVGLAMVPMGSKLAGAAAADQATIFTWGGYDIPDLFDSYVAKHGELPNMATFGGSEEGLTKMLGGYVVDVAHPCNADIPRWVSSGLFQPIDTSRLSNWSDLIPELWDVTGNVVDGKPYMVPGFALG